MHNLRYVWTLVSMFFMLPAIGQTVIVPSTNANDSSDNRPLGCYWGYERTQMLYLQSELGNTEYITEIGFYVNSVSGAAQATPVVIRMKASNATNLTSTTYASAISGATTVWSGTVTAAMLAANNWVTVSLSTSFYLGNANLEVFVETNYGGYGGETMTAKQFRQSLATGRCQYWYNDLSEPKDFGLVRSMRPNVRLTFLNACSGIPNAGSAISSQNPVCKDSVFVLSLSGISNAGGLTYQWQSSTNGTNYTNITGATGAFYNATQTAAKYYRCQVTCSLSGQSATSGAVQVTMKPHYLCYCPSYAFSSQDSKIDSVKLGVLVSGSSGTLCETYTDYTALPAPLLTPGVPQKLRVFNGSCTGQAYDVFLNVYIDYNQNSDFGSGNELVYSGGPVSQLNGFNEITFVPPTTAQPGLTRMRLVLSEQDPAGYCGGYSRGETEDYLVQIGSVTSCVSTPWSAGTTVASPAAVCAGKSVTLSLDNYPAVSGLTYQWQSSSDNVNWSSITGATSLIYTVASVTQAMYYRCRISCSGGLTQNSVPVQVTLQPFYFCYCPSYATQAEDTKLDTVILNGHVFASAPALCQTYTQHLQPVDVYLNTTNAVTLVNGSCTGDPYPSYLSVFIDYNKDGDFLDINELVYQYGPVSLPGSLPAFNFLPPSGTTAGLTGMRILLHETNTAPPPCAISSYGETEDLVINLITLPPCIDPPTAGSAVASVAEACSFDFPLQNVQLTLTGNSIGLGQTYQWEQSADGFNWTPISGATETVYFATVSQPTYYRCQVTCGASTVPSDAAWVQAIAEPAGNTQALPISVSALPWNYSGNNLSSHCFTDAFTGPDNQPSPDVFFQVSLNKPGGLKVSTCNTNGLDTYIHILDAYGNVVSANDNDGIFCQGIYASDSIYHSGDAAIYYVVVEGHDVLEGYFELEISFTPDTSIGFPDLTIHDLLRAYPNPNSGLFILEVDLKRPVYETAPVVVYNLLGQPVHRVQLELRGGKGTATVALPQDIGSGNVVVVAHTAAGIFRIPMVLTGR